MERGREGWRWLTQEMARGEIQLITNRGFVPVQTTPSRGQCAPFQLVYQLIEVKEEQNGDILNCAARALTDTSKMMQCLSKSLFQTHTIECSPAGNAV